MGEQATPATRAIPEQDAAPSQDNGCDRGKDERKSDICAQWKAADAAFDAAGAAQTQTLIGHVGLVLGAVTMLAAIAAAMFAKRAAVATEETVGIARDASDGAGAALAIAERNADAALESTKIAREGLQDAQLHRRAWLSLSNHKVIIVSNDQGRFIQLLLEWKNTGSLPAFNVSAFAVVGLEGSNSLVIPEIPEDAAKSVCSPGLTFYGPRQHFDLKDLWRLRDSKQQTASSLPWLCNLHRLGF